MATTNPFQFLQQVRTEVSKIIWPTQREVLVTSAMVLLMSALAAVFFFFVDWIIRSGLALVLSTFGG